VPPRYNEHEKRRQEYVMEIGIHEAVFELFPDFTRGVVIAKGLDNSGKNPKLEEELRVLEEAIRTDESLEKFKEHPRLAPWMEAFRAFGVNPNACPPSIINLVKRIRKGTTIPYINTVVSLINRTSLKHLVPCGGDDLEAVSGNLRLSPAAGGETYRPLGKPEAVENPKPGEIIYQDESSRNVLCRAWCWRNSDTTKITESTMKVALNVDGLPPVTSAEIRHVAAELAEVVEEYCSATTKVHILDAANPSFSL
jgi:DNA/RNA-binding domain of Phe-tRNA-synthetase-like protein